MRTIKHKIILGISGKAGVGKDTVADYLGQKFGFEKMAFADSLKEKAMRDFDLTYEQVYNPVEKEKIIPEYLKSPREILQIMGTEWFRSIDKDYWLKQTYKKIIASSYDSICITDVRFSNEINFITNLGGVVIRLERPGYQQTNHVSHTSEIQLDNFYFEWKVSNEGTKEELFEKIDILIDGIFKKEKI